MITELGIIHLQKESPALQPISRSNFLYKKLDTIVCHLPSWQKTKFNFRHTQYPKYGNNTDWPYPSALIMEEADLQLIFHNTKGIFSFLEICYPLYPQPRHRKWWEIPDGADRAAEAPRRMDKEILCRSFVYISNRL